MKVIVSHPGKQHSYRTAEALNNTNKLMYYVTSVYNAPGHITHILYSLTKGDIKKKIAGHYIDSISQNKIVIFKEWLGIIVLIIMKIPYINRFYNRLNNILNDEFARKMVSFVEKKQPSAIISYDYNSALLFEELEKRSPDIIRILDVSIAARPFMKNVFQRDYEQTKEQALLTDYPEIWNEDSLERVYREIDKADYFLVPSQIVKKSLLFCGVEESKIKIVPYGVDCSQFNYVARTFHNGALRLIFVGAVDHRKGIHHLLNVVSMFSEKDIDLKLVGAYNSNDSLYKDNCQKSNVEFCGFATHDRLTELYQKSDVFVFPTLGEGFGMVVLEAMSCGLPIIISDAAGGNDAVTDGEDGFEFQAGNDDQLYDRIKWFIDHKDKIPEMGKKARQKAEKYTWDRYSENLCQTIDEILGE